MEVGATSDSVVVEAAAVAIRTEDANITTTVSNDQFVQLPIQWTNGFYGNQAVRNPMSVAQLMPGMSGGTSYFNSQGLTAGGSSINGAPPGTFKALVDGQDSTSLYAPAFFFYQQPSVEALEEVSVQTGNYSAEFGQAQGGIFNFTAKSGTNQYHGGAFYRLSNEALNAHQPYSGSLAKSRQNNFGFTVGGPLWIPRVYDGHNKTFLFFSYEGFRSTQPDPSSGTFTTVPNANDIQGNFAPAIGGAVMCGANPCKDALGNTVLAGTVYDPLNLAADGFTRLPFPGNAIPQQRWDPVAVKLQSYLPKPMNDLQALNFQLGKTSPRPQNLPSIKVDHNFSPSLKLSAFYSYVGGSGATSTDGLPENITTSGREHPKVEHFAPEHGWLASAHAAVARGSGICEDASDKIPVSERRGLRSGEQTWAEGRRCPGISVYKRHKQYLGGRSPHRRNVAKFRGAIRSSSGYRQLYFFDRPHLGERVAQL